MTAVDPNPSVRTITNQLAGLLQVSDMGNIIECNQPNDSIHTIFSIPDDILDGFTPNDYPINSEVRIVNVGDGIIEIFGLGYNPDQSINSLNGTQLLGKYAEAVIRCRGENDWIVTGDVGPNDTLEYTVTNNGSSAYEFTGEGLTNDPNSNLTVKLGQEVIFNLNAPGHPFWLKYNQSTGAGDTDFAFGYNTKNNGLETGTLKVRFLATGVFHYNCQYHSGMHGTITVTGTFV